VIAKQSSRASVDKLADQHTPDTGHIATPIPDSQRGSTTYSTAIRSYMGQLQMHWEALVPPMVHTFLPPLPPTLFPKLDKHMGPQKTRTDDNDVTTTLKLKLRPVVHRYISFSNHTHSGTVPTTPPSLTTMMPPSLSSTTTTPSLSLSQLR